MQFVFPIQTAAVPVAGSNEFFPVHRIYCVGRNYVEHAKEMGATGREAPFFFMKPADAVLPVPEALQCEVQIAVVRRTAGALDLLDAVLADEPRPWRAWLSA